MLASDDQINRTAQALEANGIHTLIAETGEEARRLFFELVPDGSEVFLGASVTLEKLGIKEVIDKSGRFDAIRPKMFAMDRKTQAREIRKLGRRAGLCGGQRERGDRSRPGDDRLQHGQPAGPLCLQRRQGDLGGRRAEARERPG